MTGFNRSHAKTYLLGNTRHRILRRGQQISVSRMIYDTSNDIRSFVNCVYPVPVASSESLFRWTRSKTSDTCVMYIVERLCKNEQPRMKLEHSPRELRNMVNKLSKRQLCAKCTRVIYNTAKLLRPRYRYRRMRHEFPINVFR